MGEVRPQSMGELIARSVTGSHHDHPWQLRETTIHPDTRRLVQLTVDSGDDTYSIMDMLLAKKRASDRKAWLQSKGDLAEV